MSDNDLSTAPATDIADGVRSGRLFAVEVLEHQLARIEKLDEALRAFVFVDRERAEAAARQIDDAVAGGHDPGPLAGVPLAVKVTESVAGWPETHACSAFRDCIAERNSTHVDRLLAAGAVPVGLTASPPMGLLGHTASVLYGVGHNPWDLERTPGGSSGGAAASVAAGLVPLATASDMGGSIRNPASFCGVVGMKPTLGRIPRGPGYLGQSNLVHLGPIVRTVVDAARYLDCTAGPSERDPSSGPPPVASFEQALTQVSVRGLRVAWVPELGGFGAEPAIESALAEAVDAFVRDADLDRRDAAPALPRFEDVGVTMVSALAFSDRSPDPELQAKLPLVLMDLLQTPGAAPVVEMLAASVGGSDLDHLIAAHHARFAVNEALANTFEEVDAIFTPTMPFPPFPAGGPITTAVRGQEVGLGAIGTFTMPFNLSGHPAASVPGGLVDGLPIGLQIVGRRHQDHVVLALASAFERCRPWPLLAPGY